MVLLCLLVGALYAFILYRKDRKLSEFSTWLLYLLASIRFLLTSLLCILLLAPLFQHLKKIVEDPIVILAHDNSSSILMIEDSNYYRTEYRKSLKQLQKNLSKDYELVEYTFGESVESGIEHLDFNEKFTDISDIIQQVEDRYANRNVGALILASDGIYNHGSNPIYAVEGLNFPIYSIALGDSTPRKDILVKNIHHNQLAYFGNKFPVVVDISAIAVGDQAFSLQILKDGKILFQENIANLIDVNFHSVSTNLVADGKGLQKYTAKLSFLEGEVSHRNNSKDFYVDVLDGKQRILILANSAHPDIKAISETLEINENYEVNLSLAQDFKGSYDDFDLVILHQLPSNSNRLPDLLGKDRRGPNLMFVIGMQTNISLLDNLIDHLRINGFSNRYNEVQATVNNNFPLFRISSDFKSSLESWPPVHAAYANYILQGQNHVLLSQKIGMVSTEVPLLYFHQEDDKKIGIFTAEGLWKWKLVEFAQNQNNVHFDELISKSVQYLALKTDQSFFRLSSENEFFENESVVFDAELYNSSYELINEPEIEMMIEDEKGNSYPYSFSRVANAYTLNTGVLPVGEYTYVAEVQLGNQKLVEQGQFTVKSIQLEENNLLADHQLMYQIAQNTDGGFYYPDEMDKLYQSIQQNDRLKALSYLQEETEEVINLKWIFFLLLSLLSIEWFLRKRNGAY